MVSNLIPNSQIGHLDRGYTKSPEAYSEKGATAIVAYSLGLALFADALASSLIDTFPVLLLSPKKITSTVRSSLRYTVRLNT